MSRITFSRRLILPLVKSIHPDFFVRVGPKVQQENQRCVQNLNDICESIIQLQAATGTNTATVEVTKPLAKSYSLSFYLFKTNQEEIAIRIDSDTEVKHVKLTVKSPHSLTVRGRIPTSTAVVETKKFLFDFSKLFTMAGVANPFLEASSTAANGTTHTIGGRQSRSSSDTYGLDDLASYEGVIDRRIFEVSLRRRGTQSMVGLGLGRSPLFIDNNNSRFDIAGEVDLFIRKGHLLLRGFESPAEEFDAVQKIRQFIIDFGSSVNFSAVEWSTVVIILYDGANISEAQLRGSIVSVSSSGKVKDGQSEPGYFSFTRDDGKIIAFVPLKFKPRTLLRFIREKIPSSGLLSSLLNSDDVS